MDIAKTPQEAFARIDFWRNEGHKIGLVPTMGALHEGHFSLVRRSVEECERTVATIFVNPTQFGPHEDLERYPRTLEQDLDRLRRLKADLVFTPSPDALYPPGYSTYVEPPSVAGPLEGLFRPGHFRGVTTIVLKLFQILPATAAYFGQKDYQQLAVIRQMTEDLNVPIRVVGCETVRESDGLALSSRNRYLSPEERDTALSLWRALTQVRSLVSEGHRDVPRLEACLSETLKAGGVHQIDYARVVDSQNLGRLETIDRPAVALIAAFVGETRLIDNVLLD